MNNNQQQTISLKRGAIGKLFVDRWIDDIRHMTYDMIRTTQPIKHPRLMENGERV